jgi:predicted DsbA family dithiol-disulfide isomerase
MSGAQVDVTEYTDPGCSWAWGSEPKLRLLQWRFGHLLNWRQVMGGLVDDYLAQSAQEGRKSASLVGDSQMVVDHWAKVSMHSSMPHPASLRSVNANTKIACMAVKAAQRQSPELGARVLRRLREWQFVVGEPLDNKIAVIAAISGVPGLDVDEYVAHLDDPATLVEYQRDWDETRRPNAAARNNEDDHFGNGRLAKDGSRWRYRFPTLVFSGPAGEATVAGWKPVDDYLAALAQVGPGILERAVADPTTDEVIERWGTAADIELLTLCGPASNDPTDVVAHNWGGGMFFLSEPEARSRGLA